MVRNRQNAGSAYFIAAITNVFDGRDEWFHLDYVPRLGSDTRLNQFRNNGVEKSVGFASCDPEERVRTSAPANVSLN